MSKFAFWDRSTEEVFTCLKSQKQGLTQEEAEKRLKLYGPNALKPPQKNKGAILFLSQFKSPLLLLLMAAATLSFFLDDSSDSIIILTIILLSSTLNFFQERGALKALDELMQFIENRTWVKRDGKEMEIPNREIVPGDVLLLRAGDLIPADSLLIEASYFYVDESGLTGESLPVEKNLNFSPGTKENRAVFFGTMVASGFATALVVATGCNTEYSQIAEKLRFRPPETAFELGVRQFAYFLLQVTLVMVFIIFAINVFLHKPVIESFLFSLAIAVGITPQLLPAIVNVNLAHGAHHMAKKKVVVKRLASIQNFGQMNILCTDKTGTITLGKIELMQAVGIDGQKNDKAGLYGLLNARFQAGYSNPLDQAILSGLNFETSQWKKIEEIPYDFIRKRITIVFEKQQERILIAKGAFPQMISICDRVERPDGSIVPLAGYREQLEKYYEEQSRQGIKTLALAYALVDGEKSLIFLGFLHFLDPIKPGIAAVVADLKRMGVSLKIITGDHHFVALHAAGALGMTELSVITGAELREVKDEALLKLVNDKNIFAQIEPDQKEDIVLALRQSGHVVGFLGDGANDIAAIHNADVGIAVDSGVDAAKEAADIVLLAKDLAVLKDGIVEGRRTFINTLKYVYLSASNNFSNVLSMTGTSLFLSFIPLLPKQVLLTNFFSDLPNMALATDRVDSELIENPVRWDITFIRRFMILFGILSSIADYITFAILLLWLKVDPTLFRSSWFVENVICAAIIVLAIRTRRLFFRSKPGRLLVCAVIFVVLAVPFLPFIRMGHWFEFTPPPLIFYGCLIGIVSFYIFLVELSKHFFYRWYKKSNHIRSR